VDGLIPHQGGGGGVLVSNQVIINPINLYYKKKEKLIIIDLVPVNTQKHEKSFQFGNHAQNCKQWE
jgi:hypothetical protein